MFDFTYYTPTKVVFGRDTELQTGALVETFGGTKVLLHYGSGSVIRSGLLDRIKASLDEADINYVELGGVVPNPRLSKVYEGIELCQREGVDFVLAVGGGSVIDSAKAIGYGIANNFDVWELYEHTCKTDKCASIGVVLTIAATGSEMSNSSVITKEDGMLKRSYGHDISRPKFAILNPELTMTLPEYQTMCGCTDIIMHTVERYFTQGGNSEMTDAIAEGLVRTVMKNALILKNDPNNYKARAEVMWAGSLSHNGLTGCGANGSDFVTHGLEHELGGMYDVAHGAGLAAIWGSWARYVLDENVYRFFKFAVDAMGIEADPFNMYGVAMDGIEALERFFKKIGMPISLHELGVEPSDEDIRLLAHKAAVACGGTKGSAKVLGEEDFVKIFEMAR